MTKSPVRELRLALTVEDFDEAVAFYGMGTPTTTWSIVFATAMGTTTAATSPITSANRVARRFTAVQSKRPPAQTRTHPRPLRSLRLQAS